MYVVIAGVDEVQESGCHVTLATLIFLEKNRPKYFSGGWFGIEWTVDHKPSTVNIQMNKSLDPD